MCLRLDKYLTETGAGTRSEVKKLIRAGQVTINGEIAGKPEQKVSEKTDVVCLRGKHLTYRQYEYYLYHKPAGCVTATEDNLHRTVMEDLPDPVRKDLFPVGRLDLDTEGLLLITNDGAMAHALLSPARHVPKTYLARVAGRVTDADVNLFQNGVDIGEERLTRPAKLEILSAGETSEILLTITEGKFHQVKRMVHAAGKEVTYLKRVRMGPLALPDTLAPGEYRALTEDELGELRKVTGLTGAADR